MENPGGFDLYDQFAVDNHVEPLAHNLFPFV
jgi:hypothetical protein